MKKLIALCLMATPVAAQDFSEDSTAKPWNLYAEVPAFFAAKVVDITCEITGDCAENCGDGARQIGLLREQDGALVFPNKNAQTGFQGAAVDLLPYCGKDVEVDGLLIEDPDIGANNIYLVQKIREAGAQDWVMANTWTENWEAENPQAEGKGPWFRRDPRVNAHIEETGYLGLGAEADEKLKAELFE